MTLLHCLCSCLASNTFKIYQHKEKKFGKLYKIKKFGTTTIRVNKEKGNKKVIIGEIARKLIGQNKNTHINLKIRLIAFKI